MIPAISKKWKIVLLSAGAVMLLLMISLISFVWLIYSGYYGEIPDKTELSHIEHHTASEVYSADSVLLGTYFTENRSSISLDDVSPHFLRAVIAIEDVRFFEHDGIDRRSLLRVLVKSIMLRQDAGGGSTITQQLAKNLYPRQYHGVLTLPVSKIREMIIARRLETVYDKHTILELYINTVSFGEETFGLEAVSRRFFNKNASELDIHEAALLAAVLKGPGMYHPQRNPKNAYQRRNLVVRQMEKYQFIDPVHSMIARATPLKLDYQSASHSDGAAPHFREHLRLEIQEWLSQNPGPDGETYNLYTDGLRIETTINYKLQTYAESAIENVLAGLQETFDNHWKGRSLFPATDNTIQNAWMNSEHYKRLKARNVSDEKISDVYYDPIPTTLLTRDGLKDTVISPHDSIIHYQSMLQAGFFAMHPQDGRVLVWASGPSHQFFQYDQVKARQQAASAFKPFVYAAALNNGIHPCDYYRNEQVTYTDFDEWTPRNINDEYGGRLSVRAALARSVNTISARLMHETGTENVINIAREAGITSPLHNRPSLALGTAPVSLKELTTAYAIFANGGKPVTPYYIEAIYTNTGVKLYSRPENQNPEKQVITEEQAAIITDMLELAINEGTGSRLRSGFNVSGTVAGKTGTTQNNTTGWFIGYTPELLFGSRVGGLTGHVRFRSSALGSGSATALPVCGHFLRAANNDPGLNVTSGTFYPEIQASRENWRCEHEQDDRFRDRVRDFFRGSSPKKTQFEENEESKKRRRWDPRGWFD